MASFFVSAILRLILSTLSPSLMNIEFFRRAICSRLLVSILAFATTTSVLLAADTTKKTFSIPAETADKSLKKFTDQSGLELLYSTELAAGVKTNAVNGDLEPAEAISRLLAGTGLSAVHDHDNGVFRVVRVPKPPASAPPEKNVVSRTQPRIQSEASGVTDSLVLDTYQVTGSRLG
ncbi:MAG TPA: STN domain-containing protein, partial [Opitutaceae bacterium]|nr:STN domain-containing protein [Opitutaceae bacterium]